MAKNDKIVLVLEKSSENLKHIKDGNDIILEGIFAQFGVVNNNDRIYEENEYLPHLEYLQKKIAENRLIGELDHPEKFDISLSKISHVIENLEYNKDTRTVKGRVRLLDTPQGRVAKTLVESGVPISISSRAAGLVESDKHVKIKKIFTYDLVADPGFENAVLSKMNESLGILNENVAIYDVTSKYPDMLENFSDKKINHDMTRYVTADELNTYSMLLKEEIESIQKNISDIPAQNIDSTISETVNKLVKYTNHIAGLLNENIEKQDKSEKYVSQLKEELTRSIDYCNYLKECIENGVSYTEYVAEQANKGIKYTEYVAEHANAELQFIAEQANKGIKYTEYVAEHANAELQFIAEQANKGIKYTEYIGESLSEELGNVTKYTDYLGESVEQGIEYSEYVAEQAQTIGDYAEYALHENAKTTTTEKTKTDYSSLDEKVNTILTSIKKQKVDETITKLEETAKQKVSTSISESSQHKADKVIADVLNSGEVENKWLVEAPEQFKKIWESLDESTKNDINAQAKTYNLSTPYQIKNFWETRTLTSKKEEVPVNESKTTELPKLGYSNEYLERIAKGLDKFRL
jgi:hypothetical protein